MIEYKSFTQATLGDALALVRERFPEHAQEMTRQALRNPCLKPSMGSGMIGYRDGRPVALQLGMPRKVYCGQNQIRGLVGGTTCKALKGCPLSVLLETIDRANDCGDEDTLAFGNTCCSATSQMDEASGGNIGPISCTYYKYAVIRPFAFVAYVFRRKVLKLAIPNWKDALPRDKKWSRQCGMIEVRRELSLDRASLASFWSRYLQTNKGVVLSRTPEELEWLFSARLKTSRSVFLGAFCGGECIGYIILTAETPAARRWAIGDLIAIQNDEEIIDELLVSAKHFLRRCTPAFLFETMGFPMYVQKTFHRRMPFKRAAVCNYFAYSFSTENLRDRYSELLSSQDSWFFGPYDGDMCM